MIFNQINNMRKYVKACDYSKVITTLGNPSTEENGKWTATKDCWVIGECQHAGVGEGAIYVNGELIGKGTDFTFCLYIQKGTVIRMYRGISAKVFGCL